MRSRNAEIVLVISFGYLFGSILFARLISRIFVKDDVGKIGDGNPGASNVFINMNPLLGVVVALADGLKSFLPMLLAARLELPNTIVILSGSAAIVGHCFPIYYGFRGGRGVSTAGGILLFLVPREFLVSIALAALSMFFFKRQRQHLFPGITVGLSIISALFIEESNLMKISLLAIGIFLGFVNVPRLLTTAKVAVPEEEWKSK